MKVRSNLFIDITIFFGFLVATEPNFTGNTIHEWLGLAVFFTTLVHLLLHWNWVVYVIKKFFKRMPLSKRINTVVDLLIFVAFVTITFSGVMMSKSALATLGISVPNGGSWKQLHSLAMTASLYLVAIHFALHWSWVASTIKRFVLVPIGKLFKLSPKMEVIPIKVEND
jgi:hypothetical protein